MDFWFGTTNKGKLSEIDLILKKDRPDVVLKSLNDLKVYAPPPETGSTFLENARIKARSLKATVPAQWVMAEDSGLEVAGLGNLPGVHSARYAGPKASDSENVAKLLKMMQIRQVQDRSAKFVCEMVIFNPNGEEMVFRGEMKGTIAKAPAGQMGFGYDPVFVMEGQTKTLAELGPGFKNQHSHRAQAFRQFLEKLPRG